MPVKKLKDFLDQQRVTYISITHSPAYTAQEIAASAHVSGKDMAKTVIVKLDGKMAMAVLPAHRKIILQDLRDLTGADRLTLAGHAHRCRRRLFPSALEPQVRTVGSPKTPQTVECGRKPGKRYVSANRRGFRLRASSPYDAINFPYPRPTRAAG